MIVPKRVLACAGLALILTLETQSPTPAADETPYDINVILSLTGAGSFLGLSQQKALTVSIISSIRHAASLPRSATHERYAGAPVCVPRVCQG